MQRWEAHEFGDVERVLRLREVARPEPGPGEALVRVLAASVALPDLMMVRGDYPMAPNPPVSPGQEVVGIVERVSDGFPFPVGARIAGNSRADIAIGGLAAYTLVPGWSAFEHLDGLSDAEAVGFTGSFRVAHIGLHHRARLQPGETLLVLGGAGRTGSAAIQIGKAMGATVIATARSGAKAAFSREQGADHVIDLGDSGAGDEIGRITGGRGVDVVYDTVGGQAYTDATRHLARGARVLIVGYASGAPAQPDAQELLMRDYSVAGVISMFRDDAERQVSERELARMIASGAIKPPVTAQHSFDEAPQAIAERASEAMGQSVVVIGTEQ